MSVCATAYMLYLSPKCKRSSEKVGRQSTKGTESIAWGRARLSERHPTTYSDRTADPERVALTTIEFDPVRVGNTLAAISGRFASLTSGY